MNLIIDKREVKLIEFLQKKEIPHEVEMLNLGDIVITHNDKQVIVIERKTTNDLDCSIKDGRYREQKYRLLNLQKENVQVLYLIEGMHKSKQGWSAQINTMIRDNIHVFRTCHLKETVEFLETLMKNLPKYIDSLVKPGETELSNDYIDSITVKNKQKSDADIFCLQLQQLSGISSTIAKCIKNKYSSWKDLINKCELVELKELKYQCKTGKDRKIGPVVSKRLLDYLNKE